MIRNLVRNNPGELRLLDFENTLRMIDHIALTRDGIHFNTQRGRHWMNDVFQTQLREMDRSRGRPVLWLGPARRPEEVE